MPEQLELAWEPWRPRWATSEGGSPVYHVIDMAGGRSSASLCGRRDLWAGLAVDWVTTERRCRECVAHLSAIKHGVEP